MLLMFLLVSSCADSTVLQSLGRTTRAIENQHRARLGNRTKQSIHPATTNPPNKQGHLHLTLTLITFSCASCVKPISSRNSCSFFFFFFAHHNQPTTESATRLIATREQNSITWPTICSRKTKQNYNKEILLEDFDT
jgi:hypothetical protein